MNLIEHEQTREFLKAFPEAIYRRWKAAPEEEWPELRALLECCEAFEAHLRHYVDKGKIEEFRLKSSGTG